MSTYKIVVEFSREHGDDDEIVEDKFDDAPLEHKLVAQLAVELQQAYVHPDIAMAGHFDVLSMDGTALSESAKSLVNEATHECAVAEDARQDEARKAPGTFEGLMNRLHRLSPRCSTGEDNDGQIVIYTNLKEVDGKLVDLDALEDVPGSDRMKKIRAKAVENIVLEKEVEIEIPDSWDLEDEQTEGKIEELIRQKVYEKALSDLDIKEKIGWEATDTLELDFEWEEIE